MVETSRSSSFWSIFKDCFTEDNKYLLSLLRLMNTISEGAIRKFNEVLKDKDAFKKVKLPKICAGRCSEVSVYPGLSLG